MATKLRKIGFGKEQMLQLTNETSNVRDLVLNEIEQRLHLRDKEKSHLASDNDLFIPLIDTYAGSRIHPMDSIFLEIARLAEEDVTEFEDENNLLINKEDLYYLIALMSIHNGDVIKAMMYWERAQKEYELTHGVTNDLNSIIEKLRDKFRTIIEPLKINYNENHLIKLLRKKFSFIDDFETLISHLSSVNKVHFLSCGIRHTQILAKLRASDGLEIIKVFAQELINSLCVLNESLLKERGVTGNTLGSILNNDLQTLNPGVASILGNSSHNNGLYGKISKSDFSTRYHHFIQFIETSVTTEDEMKANALYALHRLRNDALHVHDSGRSYYNDKILFEKTIGLLFITVAVIKTL